MSIIATALKHMLAAGMDHTALLAAVAEMEQQLHENAANDHEPTAGALRQRRYRERHKPSQNVTRDAHVTESVTSPLSLSPNEINSNPHTHTPGDISRARKGWACPEGVDRQHWADFLANRKLKRLAVTETAYRGQLRELAKFSDDDWPPGRIIQFAAEKGWGGIYDPRNSQDNRNGRQIQPANSLRGSRPDPSLDMLYAAQAEIRAAEDQGDDRAPWAALPSH